MASVNTRTLLSTLIVTALAGAMQPAWAVSIDQQPLILPTKVKPAFIMALDNSGSIASDETLCRTNQGDCYWSSATNSFWDASGVALESGNAYVRSMRGSVGGGSETPRADKFGGSRDPEFNRAYFNPTNLYTPWVNFDGSPYLGTCPAGSCSTTSTSGAAIGNNIANYIIQSGASAGDAVISAAPEDPRHPSVGTDASSATTMDFTKPTSETLTYDIAVQTGDIIPAGDYVEYSTDINILHCDPLKAVLAASSPANNTFVKLTTDYPLPASCNGASNVAVGNPPKVPAANTGGIYTLRYYPGTVFLTTKTAAGAEAVPGFNYANVITVPKAGPAGVNLYKYEIIPANFAVAADYNNAIQNFANYWSFFSDRGKAIVAAATQAFEGVDFMRVGEFNISSICVDPTHPTNCEWISKAGGNYTSFVAGPDSSYSEASPPAGDPLVPMYDMSDYTYKQGVAINPIPPGPACTTPGVPGIPAGCVSFSSTGGDRWKFYQQILAFDYPNDNTPTRQAVFRMGHQFQRVTNNTATGLSDPNPPILNACQANAGMLFTDGYINDNNEGIDSGGLPAPVGTGTAVGNVDAGTSDVGGANNIGNAVTHYGQAPYKDSNPNTFSDIASWYYQENLRPDLNKGKVPVASGCPSITLDCNPNLHMNFYGIPLGARGTFYDVAPYIDNLATPQDEATMEAYVTSPTWAANSTINLSPPDVDDIWHAAIDTHGGFISAQSPAAVRQGIRSVIDALLAAALNSGSLPVLGVRLGAGSLSYAPSFAFSGTDWNGDLVANVINTDGSTGALDWDAGSKLKLEGNGLLDARTIFIDTTAGSTAGHVTATFDQSNAVALGATETTQLGFLGLNESTFHGVYGASTTVGDVINYLKGDHSDELQNGGQFRNRAAVLGDIVDSEPTVSSDADDFGFSQSLLPAQGGGATYTAFLTSKATRTPATMVYVGANDGMLHAFDGTPTGGNEKFAFIPNSVANKLGLLLSPDYVHNFYVDGNNTVFDAYLGSAWKTVLVGSTGAGGSGAYALDVTNPASFNATNVMWEVTSATDPDIGANVGTPLVFLAEDNNWYAAFGNGYNSTNSNPVLILVNLTTGVVSTKLTGNDGGAFDNGNRTDRRGRPGWRWQGRCGVRRRLSRQFVEVRSVQPGCNQLECRLCEHAVVCREGFLERVAADHGWPRTRTGSARWTDDLFRHRQLLPDQRQHPARTAGDVPAADPVRHLG